ncbi:MAG: GNAT family N-acetyltransferase [Chloroflexota bacterium]
MVVTANRYNNRPRPINLNKDIPQVVRLLESVFGESLDSEGRHLFSQVRNSSQPAMMWRFNPNMARLSPGFVWEENGRIVGNVTLLPTQTPRRFLVANVAVHSDFRRQGLATLLMQAVHSAVAERRGDVILLQVVKENAKAVNLYRNLRYQTIGSMTEWYASSSRIRDLSLDNMALPPIRPLHRREWQAAYQLDLACLHPDLNWPEPLKPDAYKVGLWQQFSRFLNGRQQETWRITNNDNQVIGLGSIFSEWGRTHRLTVRVAPAWRGQIERPLLAKLLRRLRYLPRRNVRIDHSDLDQNMNQLLEEARFRARRTLTHMRLDLK